MNTRVKGFFVWAGEALLFGVSGAIGTGYSWWVALIPLSMAIALRGMWIFLWNRFDKNLLRQLLVNLNTQLAFNQTHDVRCRLYARSLIRPQTWVCVCWYPDKDKPHLRSQQESEGIIGLCARTREAYVEAVEAKKTEQGYKGYSDYLIRRWGFSEKRASVLTRDRSIYYVAPLETGDGSQLLGVLYFDSKNVEALDGQTLERIQALVPMAAGIVRYALSWR